MATDFLKKQPQFVQSAVMLAGAKRSERCLSVFPSAVCTLVRAKCIRPEYTDKEMDAFLIEALSRALLGHYLKDSPIPKSGKLLDSAKPPAGGAVYYTKNGSKVVFVELTQCRDQRRYLFRWQVENHALYSGPALPTGSQFITDGNGKLYGVRKRDMISFDEKYGMSISHPKPVT